MNRSTTLPENGEEKERSRYRPEQATEEIDAVGDGAKGKEGDCQASSQCEQGIAGGMGDLRENKQQLDALI